MKPDDFESQLQRQPLHGLPAEWRTEILSAAQEAAAEEESGFLATLWRELFVQPKFIWGSIGAAWLIIIALNLASGVEAKPQIAQVETKPAEVMQAVREQNRLRDELLGIGVAAIQPSPADRPREGMKPRSERQDTYAVA